jgi:catechol 2,3-dioxygenase-like lactoylglutathione lyase family enzyme
MRLIKHPSPDASAQVRRIRDPSGVGVEVSGVSELVLEVVDLEAAERFYAGVLGLPVVERWPDREAIWVMAGDRTRIGLWRPQVGLQGGRGGVHVHFAMHVPADRYDAAAAHLRAQGQDVREEVFGTDHGRALYVDDPDGNVVELWTWDVARHLGASP